jgi:hypothetical protein
MYKIAILAFLLLALIAYSSMTEQYQNFSYYPGYGDPVYSGVPGNTGPYIDQTQYRGNQGQQQGQQGQEYYQGQQGQEYYQ